MTQIAEASLEDISRNMASINQELINLQKAIILNALIMDAHQDTPMLEIIADVETYHGKLTQEPF